MNNLKEDFPIFKHHPKLVYLDSAATSLKPNQVLEAEREYYEQYGVNVHRGVYALSVKATEAYEGAREKVRKFINAKSTKEIVFTKGATEGINLVAGTISQMVPKGSVILTTAMEHHSNIVPWQALTQWGFELRYIPVTGEGQLDLSNIHELLQGVKLVTVTQMSNTLGTVNDVKMLAEKAHAVGAKVLVDGAQSVAHMPVDVQDLDCDFLVFSGHKMLGPTGIGVLYAKEELLKDLPPYQRGGDMVLEVTQEAATWNELPYKFEAGTPNIAGAVGLGAAVDYLQAIGMENVWKHEQELANYGIEQLKKVEGLTMLGAAAAPTSPGPSSGKRGADGRGATPEQVRGSVFSFTLDGIHPHDIGTILDEQHIAVRAGHHCTMVLHRQMGLPASTRASAYMYSYKSDIDALVQGLREVHHIFSSHRDRVDR